MDREPMIERLRALGFRTRDSTVVFARVVGGRRELRVILLEEQDCYSYYMSDRYSGARSTLLFSTLEDMEIAIVYQTLVGRRRAWPMTWLGDSDHA